MLFKFIDAYSPIGFKGIDRSDPLVVELEEVLERNNQFIYVGDIINMQFDFFSKGCLKMIGIKPEDLNPHVYFSITSPEDMLQHSIARARMIKLASEIYTREESHKVMSTNLRLWNAKGSYSNIFMQCYLWLSQISHKTVYGLFVQTDISCLNQLKHGYSTYIGDDLSYFRYPDEELIMNGNIFSDREFEIIKLVELGSSSEQIAQKLFLSVHTVNTHRRRILKKAKGSSFSEIIHNLKEKGAF